MVILGAGAFVSRKSETCFRLTRCPQYRRVRKREIQRGEYRSRTAIFMNAGTRTKTLSCAYPFTSRFIRKRKYTLRAIKKRVTSRIESATRVGVILYVTRVDSKFDDIGFRVEAACEECISLRVIIQHARLTNITD